MYKINIMSTNMIEIVIGILLITAITLTIIANQHVDHHTKSPE